MLNSKKKNLVILLSIISAVFMLLAGICLLNFKEKQNLSQANNVSADEPELDDWESEYRGYCGGYTDADGRYQLFGKNVRWEYDPETFTLSITGNGTFASCNFNDFVVNVKHIVIGDGITEVSHTFNAVPSSNNSNFSSVEDLDIADSVVYWSTQTPFLNWRNYYAAQTGLFCVEDGVVYLSTKNNPHYMLFGAYSYAGTELTLHSDTKVIASNFARVSTSGNVGGTKLFSNIILNDGLVCISPYAFVNQTNLTSISIPASVKKVGNGAINSAGNITTITVNENNTVYNDGNNQNVVMETATNNLIAGCNNSIIPSTTKVIERSAFAYSSVMTSITIPNGVTKIEEFAFENCSSLRSIDISGSVVSIGAAAFRDCSSLETVTLHEGLKVLGGFSGCCSLKNFEIPDGVTDFNCDLSGSLIEEIEIPNSVVNFNTSFADCSELTTVVLGSGVQYVPDLCFQNCDKLTTVRLSNNIRSIGRRSFYTSNTNAATVHLYINSTKADFTRNLTVAMSPARAVAEYSYGEYKNGATASQLIEVNEALDDLAEAIENCDSVDYQGVKNAIIVFAEWNGQTPEQYNTWINEKCESLVSIYNALIESEQTRFSSVKTALQSYWSDWKDVEDDEVSDFINTAYPSVDYEIERFFNQIADSISFNSSSGGKDIKLSSLSIECDILNDMQSYDGSYDWNDVTVRPCVVHFDESLTSYYTEVFEGVDTNAVSYDDNYVVEGGSVTHDEEGAPQTGIAVDFTLTIISIIMLGAVLVCLKRKSSFNN